MIVTIKKARNLGATYSNQAKARAEARKKCGPALARSSFCGFWLGGLEEKIAGEG